MAVFRQASQSALDANEDCNNNPNEQLNNNHSSPQTQKKLLDTAPLRDLNAGGSASPTAFPPTVLPASRPSRTLPTAPTHQRNAAALHQQQDRVATPPSATHTLQQQLDEVTAERDALRLQLTALEERHQNNLESLMAQADDQDKTISDLRDENAALQSTLQSHRHVRGNKKQAPRGISLLDLTFSLLPHRPSNSRARRSKKCNRRLRAWWRPALQRS
jgi:hypothetical protein